MPKLNWTVDELILMCAELERNDWRALTEENPRTAELSRVLRALPIYPVADRPDNFRSISAVRRKMVNIVAKDESNGAKLDEVVLTAYLDRPAELRAVAEAIEAAARVGELDELPVDPLSDEDELPPIDTENSKKVHVEGGLLIRRALVRERSRPLRQKKIKAVLHEHGTLACEVCGFDFEASYGEHGRHYAECHHKVPLHVSGEVLSDVDSLAVICANCHRMIHRRKPWLTLAELQEIVRGNR